MKIESKQTNWYGHMMKLNKERLLKKINEEEMEGNRRKRRPMKT